jgi:hypothetical protein
LTATLFVAGNRSVLANEAKVRLLRHRGDCVHRDNSNCWQIRGVGLPRKALGMIDVLPDYVLPEILAF